MQREDILSPTGAVDFVAAVCVSASSIYEAYSEFEATTRMFRSHEELVRFVDMERSNGRTYFTFAVHYEGTGGTARTRRFNLEPEKCDGALWRETTEGWGLVSVQLTCQENGFVKCRVSANSQKRAVAWAATMEDRLGATDAWHWALVEKHTRRLIRKLRSAA